MHIEPHRLHLSDISAFQTAGVRKMRQALSSTINGYTFAVNTGTSQFEQAMSANTLELLTKDPVCIIGTSFAVPYFNDRKKFRSLALFLAKFSNTFTWMIPDEPYVSTCQARGLDEISIAQKVAHYKGNLLAKVQYAEYGIKDLNIKSKAFVWDNARQLPEYFKNLETLSRLYRTDEHFKSDADQIVRRTLQRDDDVEEFQIETGKDFLLKELACILAIAASLNRPAVYVYQTPWEVPILEKLGAGAYGVTVNEEVGVLIITASS